MDESYNIRYFKCWLIFVLLVLALQFAVQAFMLIPWGIIGGMLELSDDTRDIIHKILSYLISLGISYFCFKETVRKYILPQTKEKIK